MECFYKQTYFVRYKNISLSIQSIAQQHILTKSTENELNIGIEQRNNNNNTDDDDGKRMKREKKKKDTHTEHLHFMYQSCAIQIEPRI